MKILIVEDSATLRYRMCQYVRNAGHEPIVAENGESALQILDTTNVDMVVMDVEMPGLDGFETTRFIRDWFGEFWIPIIFVTGKNEEHDLRQGIDAGGDDYLIKPISATILQAKIRAMERIIEMRDQLSALNVELTELSERDCLTRLYNRRTFEERAMHQWRIATRSREPLAALIMDIDHFKAYNDSYGHIAGDECIKRVAETIERCLSRPGDLVARYGGEEFVALLPDTDESGAQHVAERIRKAVLDLEIEHRQSDTHAYITMSIGGTVVNQTSHTDFIDQVNAADKALYAAKQGGRNRVIVKPFNTQTTILIAETGCLAIRSIDGKLTHHCAVMQSRTIEESLDLAVRKKPNVVVIDEELSGTSGRSLARQIRLNPVIADTPIVMLVKAANDQHNSAAEAIDAAYCFVKPFVGNDLVDKLNELLFFS